MRVSTFSLLLAATTNLQFSTALPTELTNFLLVTTSQSESGNDSSSLVGVNVTSLFDPSHSTTPTLYLRPIGPGYSSLPNFTLSSGVLSTLTTAPHGQGYLEYYSKRVLKGEKLQFLSQKQENGNIALDEGGFLVVDGRREGWRVCSGDLGARMVFWEGDMGCEKTFLKAVEKAPY